jgi:hypothetical protein
MRLICSLRCRSPICRTIIGKKYRSVWVDIPSVLYDPPITAVEELAMLDAISRSRLMASVRSDSPSTLLQR